MAQEGPYSGFQWNYFFSLREGPVRTRADAFMLYVDWKALLGYASNIRNGMDCELLPEIGLGCNHMVRIIRFKDQLQWVARLGLPSLQNDDISVSIKERMEREISTMALVRRNTKIHVPEVYGFAADGSSSVKAPFMLMECLEGNVGMDLGMEVPLEYQHDFFKGLAGIQVELSTIQLPLIGTIQAIDEDGTIHQGPIPGLGGPFSTATEFFQAWCNNAKFPTTSDKLRSLYGPLASEIIPGIESFPTNLAVIADRLSKFDKGPFPLVHGDFGHSNIVVDGGYRIIGVIDWELAFAAPWEIAGDFPLTLSTIPPAMDAPWNYDETGQPKDPDLTKKFADQEGYITQVRDAQDSIGIKVSPCLVDFLQDSDKQRLTTAMIRLYPSGKAGYYDNLFRDIS